MTISSDVFRKHYEDYCRRIAAVDLESQKETLGLIPCEAGFSIPFFNRRHPVPGRGIADGSGNPPLNQREYLAFVILANYILRCPDPPALDPRWVSFRDFRSVSHFTNVNYFSSDTETALERHFSGRLDALSAACRAIGGAPHDLEVACDLSFRFDALPRIALLLLFSDGDDEFPAKCTVLFQRQAEHYLDPESLAMTGACLAMALKDKAPFAP